MIQEGGAKSKRFFAGLHALRALKRLEVAKATRAYYYFGWKSGYLDGLLESLEIAERERRVKQDA